jgi:hypothetical protein
VAQRAGGAASGGLTIPGAIGAIWARARVAKADEARARGAKRVRVFIKGQFLI